MALQIVGGPIFGNVIRLYGMKSSLNLCYISNLVWALILWISQVLFTFLSILKSLGLLWAFD
jgi:hypothetical protein